MIDSRYFITTLVAVFLALGIGVIFGSSTTIGPALNKQQTSTLRSLGDTVENLRQESGRDRDLLNQNEEAIKELVPKMVDGKLAGRSVAIIRTGDYSDAVQSAADAIEAAGGTVASTTTLTGRLQLLDETQQANILRDLKIVSEPADGQDLAVILQPLVSVLRSGTTARDDLQSSLDVLSRDSVITTSGDYSTPVNAVLIVGGNRNDDPDPVEPLIVSELIDPTQTPSLTVAGCEPFDVASSSIADFSRAGISTVDCIDLPLGALDLPFALRAGSDGIAYGLKSTATRLVPDALSAVAAPASPALGAAH